jgi:hypothetical protein
VYSTDAHDKYQGKIHAAGACQHSVHFRRDDDLLTLKDWLILSGDYAKGDWFQHPICSKCGGFSIRRLTPDQLAHVELAYEVDDCAKSLGWHERVLARGSANHPTASREELHQRQQGLQDLRARLSAPKQLDSSVRDYLTELESRADALERRIGMRLGDV